MVNKLRKLWSLLTLKQKKDMFVLQISVFIVSVFELVTIGAVAGFMGVVTDTSKLAEYVSQSEIQMIQSFSMNKILLIISSVILVLLTISAVFSVLTTKFIYKTSFNLGHQFTSRLFTFYQSRDWAYYINKNSSELLNNTINESARLMSGVILPTINMISRLLFIIIISIAIISYDFFLSLGIIFLFVSSYVLISLLLKRRLVRNSAAIGESNKKRTKTVTESFNNIKTIILSQKEEFFINEFKLQDKKLSQSLASNVILSLTPRYVMEWLVYISMILIVVVNVAIKGSDFSSVLPLLTLYGLAAFKLLPALQQVYSNLTLIKGNISVLDILSRDLELSLSNEKQSEKNEKKTDLIEKQFETNQKLKDIKIIKGTFYYPNKKEPALNNVSITIRQNSKIGIVGPSGSGKSTLIDVLCGLLELNVGEFNLDEKSIYQDVLGWRKRIGYVPQTISLADCSIAENIAFGVHYDDINFKQLQQAIELSCLTDFVNQLPDGIDTPVGDKGMQLSGGQRQRISIARALYNESDILIFDEATSALDGITENKIMESIDKLTGKKTIILIAHRLKTIKNCDCIYFIQDGGITDYGSYQKLLNNNHHFKEMDKHA